jgi:hypothetical protein
MRKLLSVVFVSAVALSMLTGCVGRQALSKKLRNWNLEVAESKWGRQGVAIPLFPVLYATNILDMVIFNTIEFWSGTSVISNEPAIVNLPVAALEQRGIYNVASAQMRYMPDEIQLRIIYKDGNDETLTAKNEDGLYRFFSGSDLLLEIRAEDLEAYHAALRARIELDSPS